MHCRSGGRIVALTVGGVAAAQVIGTFYNPFHIRAKVGASACMYSVLSNDPFGRETDPLLEKSEIYRKSNPEIPTFSTEKEWFFY